MELKDLPKNLNTIEDYNAVCENFILPFLKDQAEKTVEIIHELHETMSQETEISQEKIDLFINKLRQVNAFANPDGVMYPYFKQVADLEARLEQEGAFK